jgi:hypothetical protein
VLAARRHGIGTLFLTLLGGGVFGNDDAWIADAVVRALAQRAWPRRPHRQLRRPQARRGAHLLFHASLPLLLVAKLIRMATS